MKKLFFYLCLPLAVSACSSGGSKVTGSCGKDSTGLKIWCVSKQCSGKCIMYDGETNLGEVTVENPVTRREFGKYKCQCE